MNKRGLCILCSVLTAILFLFAFGYVCYSIGVPDHVGDDFLIYACVYYAILLILTIVSVSLTYFSKNYYLFMAIISLLFSCLLFIIWILSAFLPMDEDAPIWLLIIMTIITPIISGIYFYGAFSKNK